LHVDLLLLQHYYCYCCRCGRYDRFEAAVGAAFAELQQGGKPAADKASWSAAKEGVGHNLRRWYRATHGVNRCVCAHGSYDKFV
jgi:hypothetical protein